MGEIGESRDTKRFTNDKEGNPIRNDLEECVRNYILFKNEINTYDSERTKIIDWEEFSSYDSWLVEKLLSDEEKISLGLKKPIHKISEEGFLEQLKKLDTEISEFLSQDQKAPIRSVEYVTVPLNKLFKFPAIKGITEKFIRCHSGNIPVYGGRQIESPIGMIEDNLENVRYFENCLAWNREGSVGYVFFHNHRFTTNDHHRPMVLKDDYKDSIDLLYIRHILEHKLLASDLFEWSKTASKEKLKKLKIEIPVDENGRFDKKKQREIKNRLEQYDSIKSLLTERINEINSLKVDL